jgi:serine protease
MSIKQKLSSLFLALIICFSTATSSYAQDTRNAETGRQQIYLPLAVLNGEAPAPVEPPAVGEAAPSPLLDQIIVRFRDAEITPAAVDRTAQIDALSQAAGVTLSYVREMSGEAIVIKLPDFKNAQEVRTIAERLSALPEVEFAEPDLILQPHFTPDDPRYPEQWHYFTPIAGNYGINLPPAWDITTGTSNVVVAVIDTGVRPHVDLDGRIVGGYDFISNVAIANDGNGRDADASDPGNWITLAESTNNNGPFASCEVRNSSWHGTHVAGIIGANSNNGLGIYSSLGVSGVNWQARILPVRVLGKCGGTLSDISDAIRWAAGLSVPGVPANTNPARVINMSLGVVGSCGSAMQNAINSAVNAGATVIVSAGNRQQDAANSSPASCANVITVAATNRNGSRAWYSNFGATVELSAPGGETNSNAANGVLSTLNTGTTTPGSDSYSFSQGTSMAAPHVAGVVSLMLAVRPTLTPSQILTLLQSTVTPFPVGSTCTTANCGTGIVNAAAALLASNPISVTYRAHVQGIGWQNWVANGAIAGTTERSLRMEALEARLTNAPSGMRIKYRAHVAESGWLPWVYDGTTAGTTGQSRQAEAFEILLENAPAGMRVEYRVHVAELGWLPWVSNGATAGTTGEGRRAEAIQIRLVP